MTEGRCTYVFLHRSKRKMRGFGFKVICTSVDYKEHIFTVRYLRVYVQSDVFGTCTACVEKGGLHSADCTSNTSAILFNVSTRWKRRLESAMKVTEVSNGFSALELKLESWGPPWRGGSPHGKNHCSIGDWDSSEEH